ncbi:MAG: carbohydrate-binding family 9-like protein [Gemmatimonadales bacterium]|nr:carbohydrate-binding family 9-like protein [Gemmatimonadales bacterium]NIN11165.1 carbohydrate-binding family 9-like protein [Gemmatimonadales bacterium]NIN49764.1 carbohydrate-binding family 9-like protein [Gemmatimonadales bacterium]NIP07228.1 carbohydrate-binding family 9-like protein [Gemmatimonadales bacterium]NIR00441.1 carbohydrate-binding family 9-like protein [Gemmatimonadales bacterium]
MRARSALAFVPLLGCAQTDSGSVGVSHPDPRHYVCYRTPVPLEVDGRLTEPAWQTTEWSEIFVDIEGTDRPAPRWRTRVKMLWDGGFFYIGAQLEEPHVWATLTKRDTVVYQDNDFEVFLDPDGDTHNYYELEINALGTVWDLLLVKPYRDGGPAVTGWDIAGLQAAISIQGTLNDPSDRDRGWTVELALPWNALAGHAPQGRGPRDGEQWRVNFSRVQWTGEVMDGRYRKVTDPSTGRPLPEENWVWSPQGAANMHMPEMWGVVQFSDVVVGEGRVLFRPPEGESVRRALRRVYYAQRSYVREHERYASDLAELGLDTMTVGGQSFRPQLDATAERFEATASSGDGKTVWHIRHDGKIWRE